MKDADFIIGLMKTETDAVGFIPSTAIETYWCRKGHYVLQTDSRGRPRGYLLHGPPVSGRPLKIHQALIEYDHRLHGFGLLAVRQLLERALQAGSTSINLRCALDLEANTFWNAAGFHATGREPGGKRRNRTIVTYELRLQFIQSSRCVPVLHLASGDDGSSPKRNGRNHHHHQGQVRRTHADTGIDTALRTLDTLGLLSFR